MADHTRHRHVGRRGDRLLRYDDPTVPDRPCSSDAVATAGSSVALTVNALANNANGISGAT